MQQDAYKYVLAHSKEEDEDLKWIRRQTALHTNHLRMLSGPIQGELLKMIVSFSGCQNVLELGTFTGYATLCMARALPEGGHIDTLEINDELISVIKEGWERAGMQDRITLWSGDCLETMKTISEEVQLGMRPLYDLCYMDANKRDYCEYFEAVLPLLRSGGLILADNTLWDGKILEDPLPVDAQTRGIEAFNTKVAADDRVEVCMIALRDGLSIIQKK